jgi:GNAT superfamily N-acetyltransferase
MAIAPKAQRKGAGTALLQSGLKIADDLNAAVSGPIGCVSARY